MLRVTVPIEGILLLFIAASVTSAAEPDAAPLDPQQKEYAHVSKLSEAVDVLKVKLVKIGNKKYAFLISEEGVKAAVTQSIKTIEREHTILIAGAKDEPSRNRLESQAKRFREVIRPLYEGIARTGDWPAGAYFLHSPRGPHFSPFSVNLHIDIRNVEKARFELAPGLRPTGYALQIFKIEYGIPMPADDGRLNIGQLEKP